MKEQVQSGAGAHSSRDLKADATRYAARYLGVTAAERRYYQELGVDPYTNNELLRKTVHHLAKADATVNLAMHFVGIPGVPYLGHLNPAMDAIYTHDPPPLLAPQPTPFAPFQLPPPHP